MEWSEDFFLDVLVGDSGNDSGHLWDHVLPETPRKQAQEVLLVGTIFIKYISLDDLKEMSTSILRISCHQLI